MATDRSRLALIVATALVIEPGRPTTVALAFTAAMIVTLVISVRRPVPPLVAAVLLIVGGTLIRYALHENIGSDALQVTVAAAARALEGLNPYGVGYDASRPPGAPYPYGPLALAWSLPFSGQPRAAELLSAILVLALLARERRLIGLAIYAATPALTHTAVDGSNDTTLGLLLVAAFVSARSRPSLGAIVLAAAVAFKPSAAAWVPAYVVWGGWRPAASFGLASLVLWSPVVLLWGIASYLDSLARAAALHRDIVWSIGAIVRDVIGTEAARALDSVRILLGGFAAAISIRFARSLDGVLVSGAIVYLVTLFGGTWASFAYLAALAPLLCLRVDDWVERLRGGGAASAPGSEAEGGAPA